MQRPLMVPLLLSWILVLACTAPSQTPAPDILPAEVKMIPADAVRVDPGSLRRWFFLPESVFDDLRRQPPGIKGWLGIAMSNPGQPVSDPASGRKLHAIKVTRVFPQSPAEIAGIKKGDQIVAVNGTFLEQVQWADRLAAFRQQVTDLGPGNRIQLKMVRAGTTLEYSVTLIARPKTKVHLGPGGVPKELSPFPESLVQFVLDRKNLGGSYARTGWALREGAAEVVSPVIKGADFNPFRLTRVNQTLYDPWRMPIVARQLVDPLHLNFNRNNQDLTGLVVAGRTALDLPPAKVVPSTGKNFLERFFIALERAHELREEALAKLSPEELETLYGEAPGMLVADHPDHGQEEVERTDEVIRAEEADLIRLFHAALKVDLDRMTHAALELAAVLDGSYLQSISEGDLYSIPADQGWKVHREENLTRIETSHGPVLIGGKGSNRYDLSAVLIIDLGGDDYYTAAAGATNRDRPFAVVVDFAGNDYYDAGEDVAQGAGFLGAGFLIDLEGDDTYHARNLSQGMGLLGVGVLADFSGNDIYDSFAVSQGSGTWGIGILADAQGDDLYSSARYAQGFGFVRGYGVMVESEGNDRYFAGGVFPDDRDPDNSYQSLSQGFGFGVRPMDHLAGASGGIGILADAQGDDTYIADYFGQGAAYWFSLGVLADRSGNDNYSSGRYAQGAGIHFAAGVLMDEAGDDRYSADFGVSQGLGHDLAAGFLLDVTGNDHYVCGVLCQGAGNDNGIGVLGDLGGDDDYRITGRGQGWGNHVPLRGFGSFGFLFDTGGGRDAYSTNGADGNLVYRPEWGIFADTD